MLYYLDTLPVPENLQSYLQSYQSPTLSYNSTREQASYNKVLLQQKPASDTYSNLDERRSPTHSHTSSERSSNHYNGFGRSQTSSSHCNEFSRPQDEDMNDKIHRIGKVLSNPFSRSKKNNNASSIPAPVENRYKSDLHRSNSFNAKHSLSTGIPTTVKEKNNSYSSKTLPLYKAKPHSYIQEAFRLSRNDSIRKSTSSLVYNRSSSSLSSRPSSCLSQSSQQRSYSSLSLQNIKINNSQHSLHNIKINVQHQRSYSSTFIHNTNQQRPNNHQPLSEYAVRSHSAVPRIECQEETLLSMSQIPVMTRSSSSLSHCSTGSSRSRIPVSTLKRSNSLRSTSLSCSSSFRRSHNDLGLRRERSNCSLSSVSTEFSPPQIYEEYDEILALVQGSSTISKRDGLISLQAYLHGMNTLTTEQVIRMKEAFNQYFAEPNNKLYSAFLDVVSEFIVQHKNDLKDWLFVLLTRLLQRISTDYLSSSQKKIARVLDVVRDSYPYDHQFHIITKYINDKSQTPSLKLKVALLEYTRGLIQSMDPSDFVSTPTVKLAVSKIVTWISEPKSADVRKEASLVIVALFQLNSPEFSNMLSNVPNSIHEGATRVIKMHLRQVSASASRTPTDETPNTPPRSKSFDSPYDTPKHPPATTTSIPRSKSASKYSRDDYSGGSHVPGRPDTQVGADAFDSPMKGVSTLNFDSPDAPSPYTDHSTSWLTKDTTMDHRPTTNYEASLLSKSFAEDRKADGAEQPTTTKSPTGVETERMMEEICAVLSQTQISDSEDIKNALLEFHRVMRSDDKTVSLVKIRSILPTVVQLLQHKEATLRCLAARALRELAFTYPEVYRHDLETFLLPLLQAEADPQKAVSKTAEECCTIVSQLLPAGEIIPVLAPLCGGESPFPTNLSAIQLLHNISDSCNADELRKYLEPVVTNLLAAYDHTESQVRKAAVFCLVSVHNKAGESAVTPYFKDLAASKMKLLNLYIRRSQSANV